MGGVRNGVLQRVVTTGAPRTAIFTVPANFTALVKSVQVFNALGIASSVAIQSVASDGLSAAYLPFFELEAGQPGLWEGWVALNEGDQLVAETTSPSQHIWAEGAALPGAQDLLPQEADLIDLTGR